MSTYCFKTLLGKRKIGIICQNIYFLRSLLHKRTRWWRSCQSERVAWWTSLALQTVNVRCELVPPDYCDLSYFLPMHIFSDQQGYLDYSSAYKCHFVVDENTEECLLPYCLIWGMWIWPGYVCSVLCLLMLSRYPIVHTVEEFPVPAEQNNQSFQTMCSGLMVLTGCTLTQKEPLACLAKWHPIHRLFSFFSFQGSDLFSS